ncbi:MAG TPA: Asp-tRNA(Asn)/Glu-tRNA(Gln) amidotransferase subunit GatC [Alphaproteobacteria bacterium]|nr:Asp-tRNA(Asn)/Glu-tRNA(Gln) amidotransferase subunit GatC [Alphaproteobacteria bacterium]
MALDKDTVRRIARLARIEIAEDQLEGLAGELSNILGWIEQLNEVPTDDVEPMTSVVAVVLPMREDKVTDGGYPGDILQNAPSGGKGFFQVPKVVE